MKFSVLLPTRNRLEYLKYAVASVQMQDYKNWEIIVSDNCSDDDVEGYVRALNDPRIHFYRTASFCSVTDNWNNALEKSSGDYVIMLGDDDSLLKGYFTACKNLLGRHDFPDMIYQSALQYVYPDVLPNHPNGYLVQLVNASFLAGQNTPYILNKTDVQKVVKEVFNFSVSVNFNSQHCLVSRRLIHSVEKHGSFYQSPYPDYYSTTMLFIKAERILAVPYSLAVIGVSPKSFGYYYFNNKEDQGVAILKNLSEDHIYKIVKKYVMPGTNMNTSWLLSLETVKQNVSSEFDFKVNYKKYRMLQMFQHYKNYLWQEGVKTRDLVKMVRCLFWWEKIVYLIPFILVLTMRFYPNKAFRKAWSTKMLYKYSHPSHGIPVVLAEKYKNILEVFEDINENPLLR